MVAARLHWSRFIARRAFGGISGSFFSLTRLPAPPSSHSVTLPRVAHSGRDGGRRWWRGGGGGRRRRRRRRPAIDGGPAHMETGSWLNRSDRSATERLLCQTAGPLWKKIISKLLQEADACQKMLSVKVRRLLGCCLSPPLFGSHSCFLRSSALGSTVSLAAFFLFLLLLHSSVFGSRGFLRLSSSLDSFLECFCSSRPMRAAAMGKKRETTENVIWQIDFINTRYEQHDLIFGQCCSITIKAAGNNRVEAFLESHFVPFSFCLVQFG